MRIGRYIQARPTLGLLLRLGLLSVYALVLLAMKVMHLERQVDLALVALDVALWSLVLAIYVHGVRGASGRWAFVRANLGYPVFLVAPVLALGVSEWLLAAILIAGYVLQLRGIAAGHAVTFSLGLVAFIALVCTVGMVYAEQSVPTSPLRDWQSAWIWTFVRMTQMRGYEPGSPQSPDGIALSFIVGLTSLLVAGLLTAQIVSWLIGDQRTKHPDEHPAAGS